MATMNSNFKKNVCKLVPSSINHLPHGFKPFNDRIDIILQYMAKINSAIKQSVMFKSYPIQFNVYFVPPITPHESESVDQETSQKPGLDEIHSLLCSKQTNKMITDISDIFIVRKNEFDTNGDMIYSFTQQSQYEHNELLCNVMSIMRFNVAYHLQEKGTCKMYLYYNGLAERVFKQNIITKFPILFVNGKNYIHNDILSTFISSFDGFLFEAYKRRRYTDTKQRILNIPKDVLKNYLPQIGAFYAQKQLYYYLTWTCRMQVIDGEFIHYSLQNTYIGHGEIAIFNSELHCKYSNNMLYVVSTLTENSNASKFSEPKWRMYAMMTAFEIYHKYGIEWTDLPVGSRYIHKSFQAEICKNNINLKTQMHAHNTVIEYINRKNWKKCLGLKVNNNDLNKLIKESMYMILSGQCNLSLIPTLIIDLKQKRICCESLIPVQLYNKSWIAVAYKTNKLYIDCDNILNKASLVNPNAAETYKYLRNEEHKNDDIIDEIDEYIEQVNSSTIHRNTNPNPNVINMGNQHYQQISNSYFYFYPNAQ